MVVRSLDRVVIATRQPSPDVADPVGVGHPHVGQVDLVELGLAGHLAQRADLDPRRVHVEGEVGQAPCAWGPSGSVRATSIPRSAMWASVFQTFCPVITHSSPSRTARRGQAGQVGAGARLAEQLAPRLLAGERAAEQAGRAARPSRG